MIPGICRYVRPGAYCDTEETSSSRVLAALVRVVASKEIENLQPTTMLTVFHGTDAKVAHEFVVNGIDARKPHHRKYPHHSSGKKITRGIYVTPELKVARGFGRIVLEFQVEGQYLWPMFPTLMKKDNKMLRDDYPNSFRPAVSHDLLERRQENQALFVGVLPSSAVKNIYVYEGESNDYIEMSPEEFLKTLPEGKKYVVEPNENISLEEFYERVAKIQKMSVKDVQEIVNRHMNSKGERWDNFLDIFEHHAPYTVLRKLYRKLP